MKPRVFLSIILKCSFNIRSFYSMDHCNDYCKGAEEVSDVTNIQNLNNFLHANLISSLPPNWISFNKKGVFFSIFLLTPTKRVCIVDSKVHDILNLLLVSLTGDEQRHSTRFTPLYGAFVPKQWIKRKLHNGIPRSDCKQPPSIFLSD